MNKVRDFVIGDIHGDYKGLIQVLGLCNFDYKKDRLVVLGDVVDGWPDTVLVVEELLKIKNLFPIMGNHDFWCYNWMRYGWRPAIWVQQGGQATLDSYYFDSLQKREDDDYTKLLLKHQQKYFDKCNAYYVDGHRNAFIHGGYYSMQGLGEDSLDTYMWDRDLWDKAKSARTVQLNMTKMYNKVFIGHTSIGNQEPQKRGGNVWNLDTGGGWEGKLTIMNIETEEFWQSDLVAELYPEISEMRGFKIK